MTTQYTAFFYIYLFYAEYRLPWCSSRGHCWYSNAVSDGTPSNDRNPRAGAGEEGRDSAMPAAGRESRVREKEAPLALDHRTIVIVQRGLMLLVSSPIHTTFLEFFSTFANTLTCCMCSGHVLPRIVGCDSRAVAKTDILTCVIFSKHDLTLRNVAMCQQFDSETKSGARVICPHIARATAGKINLWSNGFYHYFHWCTGIASGFSIWGLPEICPGIDAILG
jgi:hypothetical protein